MRGLALLRFGSATQPAARTAAPPTAPTSARRETIIDQSTGLLSSAAKWLIAALGTIGATLIAGSQLSSIGSLPIGPRFFLAVAGLTVGLAGVLWAVWRVLDLVAPDRYTISELAREWVASGAVRGTGVASRRRRRTYPVPHWFAVNPEHLANHDSPQHLLDHWNDRDAPDRDRVLASIDDMVMLANYRRSRSRFDRAKAPLAGAMLVAAAGVCLFAWAANPGVAPPPSLRNADLSGARLGGSVLTGVDLTGADLTGADLRGALLDAAVLDDVTWAGTTCPDGVNSDDTARADGAGTCLGHLLP